MLKNIEIELGKVLVEKKMTIPKLAEDIGMSKQNLYLTIKKNDMSISTLEKICKVLDVPVSTFFVDNSSVLVPAIIKNANDNLKVVIEFEVDTSPGNNSLKMIFGQAFLDQLKK